MYYESIFRQLNRQRVKYLVAGGMAVVLHGVVRFTADLDLFVKLTSGNWARFIKAMKKLGYRAKLPVSWEKFADRKKWKKWIENRGMKVFSFYHPKNSYN